jgi:hypothetical protein
MCLEPVRLSRRRALLLAVGTALAGALPASRVRGQTVTLVDGLEIHPRDVWGASLPPLPGLQPEPEVQFLLVHHTAGTTQYAQSDVASQIQQVYRYHTGPEKGWPDVCYNFFIDRYGGLWEGRAGSLAGPVMADATGGSQGFAQLVCLLGNFHESAPSPAMIDTLVRFLAWAGLRYGLDTSVGATTRFVSRGSNRWPAGQLVTTRVVSGHRDVSQTVCPGDFVYPLLEVDIPTRVHALAASTSSPPPTPTSTRAPGTQPAEIDFSTMAPTNSEVTPTTTEPAPSRTPGTTSTGAPAPGPPPSPSPAPPTDKAASDSSTTAAIAGAVAIGAVVVGSGAAIASRRSSSELPGATPPPSDKGLS